MSKMHFERKCDFIFRSFSELIPYSHIMETIERYQVRKVVKGDVLYEIGEEDPQCFYIVSNGLVSV